MKATAYFLWIGMLIMFTHLSLAAESELLKLVPVDNDISGWIHDDETYIATDEESLAGFINGAAPFYIEHGTVEVLFQDYAKEDVYLTLEIYRMKDEEKAKQLYAEIDSENPETLEKIGTEGRFVGGLIGAYLVEYWQKSFFIRLTITEKSTSSKEAILTFAKTVSEKIIAWEHNNS
jgi:hypothetical protein